MGTMTRQGRRVGLPDRERAWPLDARTAVFVLEAGGFAPEAGVCTPRTEPRYPCRIEATIVSSADPSSLADTIVYVRDANPRHAGILCDRPLPVGSVVWINFAADGEAGCEVHAIGTIGRSREFMNGWHEGVVHFEETQPQLAEQD